MHGTLFTHQQALDDDSLLEYATALGLETTQFARALATRAYEGRVREDFAGGVRGGVNGTPAFFINSLRYDGPRDFDSFLAVLEEVAEAPRP
jgi:predicted DsbA family dithiol-disulfide isomerase